ncbi:MAG: BMP family ABC transporter substrate-binding protein [Candidatus Bipolaricaulaceae bacterium]
MKRIWAVVLAGVALGTVALGATRIKAGFIYVGPIGDYGWTHAHDVGRRIVDEKYDWLETVYVESVPEGEVETYIDLLIRQGCNVIFTTSFGFMDGTLAAAQRYPNVIFAHCSGFKRWTNMATYMADFYQVYYLNGLMAGALTKTGKIGYVAAFPIPEVKRHISAFAIGAREVNPKAEVHVRWIYEWYNPAAAKEATEALIAEGCDVFAFTEDSPTVVQVAAEKGLPSFGHYSPMYDFAPDYVVSGQLVHWEKIYEDFLVKVYKGIYTTKNLAHVDYWWLLAQGAVEVGAKPGMIINPKYEAFFKNYVIDHPVFGRISVYDLVFIRLSQMADPGITFDPFQGPIYDRKGRLVVPAGMWMSYDALITMEWAAAGIVGPWPGEP